MPGSFFTLVNRCDQNHRYKPQNARLISDLLARRSLLCVLLTSVICRHETLTPGHLGKYRDTRHAFTGHFRFSGDLTTFEIELDDLAAEPITDVGETLIRRGREN